MQVECDSPLHYGLFIGQASYNNTQDVTPVTDNDQPRHQLNFFIMHILKALNLMRCLINI